MVVVKIFRDEPSHKILYVWNGGKDGQIETIAYWVVKRESRNHMKHIDFDQ
ncbi:MAG: hypothetical protein KAR43_06720 [Deltaproteobacteria bacterium]|nr:hypothetical protein [Deltaproteobacteria bacterium]